MTNLKGLDLLGGGHGTNLLHGELLKVLPRLLPEHNLVQGASAARLQRALVLKRENIRVTVRKDYGRNNQ